MNPMFQKPLSFFKIIFSDDAAQTSRIPPAFVKNFVGEVDLEEPNPFSLRCSGKTWLVVMQKKQDGFFLCSGWSDFFSDMGLEMGDLLVFKWVRKSDFQVQAFGKNCCEKIPNFAEDDDPGEKRKDQAPAEENSGAGVKRVRKFSPKKKQDPVNHENSGKRDTTTGKVRKPAGIQITDKGASNPPMRKERKVVPDPNPGQEISSGEMVFKHKNNVYQVLLPGKFVQRTGMRSKRTVLIKDPKGKEFPVVITVTGTAEQAYMSTGWNAVWKSNGLTVGSSIALKYTHGSEGDVMELEILSRGEPVEGKPKSPEKKKRKEADVEGKPKSPEEKKKRKEANVGDEATPVIIIE